MQQAERVDPSLQWDRVTVVCTDDEGIRASNREWFGRDRVTDVISFRYAAFPGEEGDEGEILVNVVHAWQEGHLRNGPMRELALYLAHGCDHLHGGEDDTPERKAIMLAREEKWVSQAEASGLVENLYAVREISA